jgi:hypothetical protein
MTVVEMEMYCKVANRLKENNMQVVHAISAMLHKLQIILSSLFIMAVLSNDFKDGKAKGVNWNFPNIFQVFLGRRSTLPDLELQDMVFFR